MPSQIAHLLLGEEALRLADPGKADYILAESGAWFRLGCQGPDIFYHNRRTMPSAVGYGALAHKRDYGKLIRAMAGRWLERDGDPLSPWAAFVLGFSTHAALDRLAHPFIVHFSGFYDPEKPETKRYRRCHIFFERILDVLLYERQRGAAISEYDTEKMMCAAGGIPATFSRNLADAISEVYQKRSAEDFFLERRIENAFTDAEFVFRVTNPKVTAMNAEREDYFAYLDDSRGMESIALVYPERFRRDLDYANEHHAVWLHPCGAEESTKSFFELYDSAVLEASRVLGALIRLPETKALPEGLEELVGNSSLSVTSPDGRPCLPHAVDPLPIYEVLETQYRLRLEWARSMIAHSEN